MVKCYGNKEGKATQRLYPIEFKAILKQKKFNTHTPEESRGIPVGMQLKHQLGGSQNTMFEGLKIVIL